MREKENILFGRTWKFWQEMLGGRILYMIKTGYVIKKGKKGSGALQESQYS